MKQFCLLLLLSLFFVFKAEAQMSQFKALFLFNFAKNVDWPQNAQDNNFVITVIGDEELGQELRQLANIRKIGSKSLIIEEASGVEDLKDSHMVFLSSSKSSLMPILESYQKEKPVLLVADKQGLCSQGAGISFFTANGKLKFEVSPRNIESKGLKLSQKLIALGSLVQ